MKGEESRAREQESELNTKKGKRGGEKDKERRTKGKGAGRKEGLEGREVVCSHVSGPKRMIHNELLTASLSHIYNTIFTSIFLTSKSQRANHNE